MVRGMKALGAIAEVEAVIAVAAKAATEGGGASEEAHRGQDASEFLMMYPAGQVG